MLFECKILAMMLPFCRSLPLLVSSFVGLEHASVGIYAIDCTTKKVVIEENCDLSLIPASCMKIITTGAALHILGAQYRFETKLEVDETLGSKGVLHGNLFIRGGGDPCLGSNRIPGSLSWEEQIRIWADAVEQLGVRRIEGRVIGDSGRWELAMAAPSWSWEDLGNYYGAGASALSFHENCISLVFQPGDVGKEAKLLRAEPPVPLLVFQNEVKTGPEGSGDGACIYGSEFSFLQCIRGTIPAGVSEFTIKGAIPDPAAFCAGLLAKELQERGIEIVNGDLQGKKRTVFHSTLSPSLGEIVFWTNQKSINLYAEHLLKKMGEVVCQEGSTQAGIRAVTEFWRSQGIDLNGFQMADGSGLSRKNLITPKQMVEILVKIKESEHFSLFFDSLPQVNDSIRAKSGSMSLIKGYGGYAGKIAFMAIVNQCLDRNGMNKGLERVLLELNKLD